MKNSFLSVSLSFLRDHYVKLLVLFFGVFVPLFVFGNLAEDILEHEGFSFDRPILMFVHSHASQVLDMVMVFCTRGASADVLVPINILVFSFLIYRNLKREAFFWVCAVVGAALLNFIAKHAFGRMRPGLWPSIAPEVTYSFPSGHAMNSMAVMTALVMLAWDTRWRGAMMAAGAFFIVLVGLSRVYLGVHYPSDILAGWAASVAWVAGLASLFFTAKLGRHEQS